MSLSTSLLMLVFYTALGYVVSFKIPNDYFKKLQFVLFNLIVPPYIFLNIYNNLTVDFFLRNYFIIIGQVWFIVLAIIFFKWIKSARQNVDFNVLAFQNAVFMALPIVVALPDSENLKLLVFMFMIGFNIAVFSLGAVVLSDRASLKSIINVPFFASVVPIVLVFLGVRIGFEDSVIFMEKLLGFILMPGALFFFGGVINFSIQGKKILFSLELARLVIVKYLIFPFLTYILLFLLKVDPSIMIVFMLQSLMPPAVNLVLLPSSNEDKDQMGIQMVFLYAVFMVGALVFAVYQL